MVYLNLFLAFFQIGMFSIGGGYAALPLIEQQIVQTHQWLTMGEFADVITISQMTPGPIAINAATFVGTRIAGLPGALVATMGSVFAPFIIVMLLAFLYRKYANLRLVQGVLGSLRPAVVGLIGAAGVSIIGQTLFGGHTAALTLPQVDWIAAVLLILGLAVLRIFKPNAIWVMLGAGALGGALYALR